MGQHGFFFDQSRCSGCQACAVACKSTHELPPGPLKYLRIYQYEEGAFPEVRIHVQWIPCYHCEHPACVDACPTGAVFKEEGYGAVLIEREVCTGCRACHEACPYGAFVFESDAEGVAAEKCDMCIDRLRRAEKPVCVLSCPLRALDFGPLKELEETYGNRRDLDDLPDSRRTLPSVVFKAASSKRRLVPYDADKARALFMKRASLPAVYRAPADVTDIPEGLVGRDRAMIKHASCGELMKRTKNDDG